MLYVTPGLLNLTKHHRSIHLNALWLPHLAATHHGVKISVKFQINQGTKELLAFLRENEGLLQSHSHTVDGFLSAVELHRNSCQIFQVCVWILDNATRYELELRVSLFVRGFGSYGLLHSEERKGRYSYLEKPMTSISAQQHERSNALIIENDGVQRENQATEAWRIERESILQRQQRNRWWNLRADSKPSDNAVDLALGKSIPRKGDKPFKTRHIQRSSSAQPERPGTRESAQPLVPFPANFNARPLAARRHSLPLPFDLENSPDLAETLLYEGNLEESNISQSRHTKSAPDVSLLYASKSEDETTRDYPKPIPQDESGTLFKHELGTESSTSNLHNAAEDENTHTTVQGDQMVSREGATGFPVSIWRMRRLLEDFGQDILVSLRYLEPPLQDGSTRLRWYCKCGASLSGDVMEYREGGVARLIERMEQTTGSKIEVASHSRAAAAQRYTFRLPSWIHASITNILSTFGHSVSSSSELPQHRASGTTTAHAPQATGLQAPQQTLHMMACMQRGRYQRTVHQGRIDDIATDQALFSFMRKQLVQHRGKIRRMFSLKCVRGIYFVKFRLRVGGNAEVRNHEPCCTSSFPRICECIPPALKVEPSPDAEYRCAPAGPLDTWPPVLSEELMHMLTSPQCVNPKETFVLEQLPKRTKGELIGTIGRSVEGWGIHFQEGWDFDLLIGLVLAVFLLASLLFAVLWSHFKLDVQGAFGVSSYMVTASGIFVAWFANRAGKLG
ncbi:hypothetical protein HBI12_112360 [Parastagonospora nodorum]|nr:hypothetical protein HBI12_112360 [Parastagonospora nodorum]KAH5424947.1 hypothetical protein HBI47_123150 [Parastagonospora nodorum]